MRGVVLVLENSFIIPRETEGYGVERVRLSVRLSVCPSVRLSVRPSVRPSPLDMG